MTEAVDLREVICYDSAMQPFADCVAAAESGAGASERTTAVISTSQAPTGAMVANTASRSNRRRLISARRGMRAIQLALLPDMARGYDQIKLDSVQRYRAMLN